MSQQSTYFSHLLSGPLAPAAASQVELARILAGTTNSNVPFGLGVRVPNKEPYSLLGAIDYVSLSLSRTYNCSVYPLDGVPTDRLAGYAFGISPTPASLLYGNWPRGYEILYTGHTEQSVLNRFKSHHKIDLARNLGANVALIYRGISRQDILQFEWDVYSRYKPILNDVAPPKIPDNHLNLRGDRHDPYHLPSQRQR